MKEIAAIAKVDIPPYLKKGTPVKITTLNTDGAFRIEDGKGVIIDDKMLLNAVGFQSLPELFEKDEILMAYTFDQICNPEKHGLMICTHCNGYGSSLKEEADRCTKCGGTGVVPKEPFSKENPHPKYPYEDYLYEITNGDTQLSYIEWVEHSITRDSK